MMSMAAWVITISCLSFTGSAFFIWMCARRSGQFQDVEAIKYRMLDDDEFE